MEDKKQSLKRLIWLKERKTYIGGSDVAAIIGLNPFKSPLSIYLEKTSPDIEEETNQAAMWGTILEDVIAKEYERKTGFNIENEDTFKRHPEYNFIGANIDRWANNRTHLLECKTTNFMKSKEWGKEYTDQIPESYLCQVAYYAAIYNVNRVDIAVLIGGQDFRIYTYNRQKDFEDKLLQIACNFWNNHVLKEIPPESINIKDISALYPNSNRLQIEANDTIVEKIMELRNLKDQDKVLDKQIQQIQFEIQNYMKDYEILLDLSGNTIATWKNSKPRAAFDLKSLQEKHNDLYMQYAKENKGSRIFLIK